MIYSVDRVAQRCFQAGADLVATQVYGWVHAAYERVWRSSLWPYLRADGMIAGEADIETGTVAVTQGGWTATFSTDPGQAAVGMHLRVEDFSRMYRLEAYQGAGVFLLSAPFEETTDASASFVLRRVDFRGPVDFWRLDTAQNAEGLGWVEDISARGLERETQDPWVTGQPYLMACVGGTRASLYDTGTVTIEAGTTQVDLAGGTWWSGVLNRRFVLRDAPELGWFRAATYTSTTRVQLDRAIYYRGGSGMRYSFDPAGEPLYRLYPQPEAYRTVEFKYFRQLPPLQGPDDIGQMPEVLQEAWVACAMELCGVGVPGAYERELKRARGDCGLAARPIVRAGSIDGPMGGSRGSILPPGYPNYRGRGR
jgi:hypothetical protein